MRLNAISPSDNPMEKHLYCFGGDGDGGSGDGTDDGDVGTAGSGGGVAPGGQASDAQGNFGGGGSDPSGMADFAAEAAAANAARGYGGSQQAADAAAAVGAMDASFGGGDSSSNPFGVRRVRAAYTPPRIGPDGIVTAVPGFAPQKFGSRSTVDVADLAAMSEIQDALAGSGRSDITSGDQTGFTDLSTMIDPSNQLDPFGEGFMSPEEKAAIEAAEAATNVRTAALAMPSLDISKISPRATAPTPAPAPAPGIAGLGPVADITVSYGKPRDAVDQSIDRAISDFAGYRVGQERKFDADGNVTTEDFALSRDLVSLAPEFGAAYNPAEQQRMQEGINAMPAISIPDIDVFGAKIPASIAGRIVSDIVKPASAVERALREGATPVPDAQGRIAGAVDERGTVYSNTPFGDMISGIKGELAPGMQEAYDAQRARQEEEQARSGGDGGGQAPEPVVLPDPITEECPAGYVRDGSGACVYEGQNVVRDAQYTPAGPRNFNYTGIPSLAPFTLRPSPRLPAQPVDPFALLRSPRS